MIYEFNVEGYMIFEICAVVAVIIFGALAYYIYRSLRTLQHTLKKVNHLLDDAHAKSKKLDSTFQSISNLGDISRERTSNLREQCIYGRNLDVDNNANALADFILAGIRIGAQYLRRK